MSTPYSLSHQQNGKTKKLGCNISFMHPLSLFKLIVYLSLYNGPSTMIRN